MRRQLILCAAIRDTISIHLSTSLLKEAAVPSPLPVQYSLYRFKAQWFRGLPTLRFEMKTGIEEPYSKVANLTGSS